MSTANTKPVIGFVLSLFGAIITLVDAIVYLIIEHDELVGILGVIFAILVLVFASMGYFTKEKAMRLTSGLVVLIIGFIVMIAGGSLLTDFIAIGAGLLIALGGIFINQVK